MTPEPVILADARWLAARPDAVSGHGDQAMTAWFLGDDHGLYAALCGRLGTAVAWGDTGPRLNAIAERNLDAFVNLGDGFDVDDADWWELRNISERGPYTTTIVAECCRLILFCEAAALPGRHLFIVETPDLADVLAGAAAARGLAVRRLGPGPFLRRARAALRTVLDGLRFARALGRAVGRIRRLHRRRRERPVPVESLRRCDVLIAVWTKPGDFNATAPRDIAHSMGVLPKLLRDRGLTVGFLALPLEEVSDPEAIVATVLNAQDAAILPDDCLGTGAAIAHAWRSLHRRARPRPGFAIGGQAMDAVADMVIARERFDWRAASAAMWSEIGPHLARLGCRPRALFHVYENQTWEKAVRQGLRRGLPATRIVGCHQSPMSKLYPSMLPSRAEVAEGRWPDAILTHGARGHRQLTEAGAPADRVVIGGLIRQGAFLLPRQAPPARGMKRAVCATGPGYQECCELAAKSAAAVAGRGDWEVIVNFHPLTTPGFRRGVQDFVQGQAGGTANVRYSDQPIRALLDGGVRAVLYADTNAGFEGVSSGARIINVRMDHALAFDKLPDGMARRAYSAAEIAAALDAVDDADRWPSPAAVAEGLADCFSDIDVEKILLAAGLDAGRARETKLQKDEVLDR